MTNTNMEDPLTKMVTTMTENIIENDKALLHVVESLSAIILEMQDQIRDLHKKVNALSHRRVH